MKRSHRKEALTVVGIEAVDTVGILLGTDAPVKGRVEFTCRGVESEVTFRAVNSESLPRIGDIVMFEVWSGE